MRQTDIAPTNSQEFVDEYESHSRRKLLFILLFVAAAVVALGVSLNIGARDLSFFQVFQIIFDHLGGKVYDAGTAEWMNDFVVWELRLPRAVFALIAGAALAVAGAAMQSVMNNPLADPYTTGISSGACFGVAVALVLGFSVTGMNSGGGMVINAFLFALFPMAMIVLLAPKTKSSPTTLILAGIAISYMFNAFSTLLLVSTSAETLAQAYVWQVGSIQNLTWDQVPVAFIVSAIGIVIISYLSKTLNVLSLGDASAKSLGLNVDNLRIVCLLVMSFMIAAIVSYAGIIGFVGLVSPHIVRMVIGADNRHLIPAAAVFSAVFFLSADIIGRIVSPVGAIPVGVILSFIGAPIFLYLIIRRDSNVW